TASASAGPARRGSDDTRSLCAATRCKEGGKRRYQAGRWPGGRPMGAMREPLPYWRAGSGPSRAACDQHISRESGVHARDLADGAPVLVLESPRERGHEMVRDDGGERQRRACIGARLEEEVRVLQPAREGEPRLVESAGPDAV